MELGTFLEAIFLVEKLTSFDVIFAVLSPFDLLDESMRRWASEKSHGYRKEEKNTAKDRAQKWMAFVLGVGIYERVENKEEIALPKTNFNHFDLMLFRSYYEMHKLGTLVGVEDPCVVRVRCDHAFGIGGENENAAIVVEDENVGIWQQKQQHAGIEYDGDEIALDAIDEIDTLKENSEDEDQGIMMVCFIEHSDHCMRNTRRRILALSEPIVEEGKYLLLLIGGTWDAWLELGIDEGVKAESRDSVVQGETVHQVVHITAGSLGNEAFSLFARAKVVYILHHDDRIDNISTGRLGTTHDVIWPMVMATRFGARVHLSQGSEHLLSVVNEGCDRWWHTDLQKTMRRAIGKLHGLASKNSRVVATPLPAPIIHRYEQQQQDIGERMSIVYLRFRLEFFNYVPGRDGQCCIIFNKRVFSCIIRNMRELVIEFRGAFSLDNPVLSSSNSSNLSLLQFLNVSFLELELRGNLFSDPIFIARLSLLINNETVAGIAPPVDASEIFFIHIDQ